MQDERIIEPLLYIDQPSFRKPKAFMQVHYQNQKKDEATTTPLEIKDHPISTNHHGNSFKDLQVKEKINYLINLPSEVPKIKCEVLTDNEKHRGILIDESEKEITLRILGRENEVIEKSEIININLIGF